MSRTVENLLKNSGLPGPRGNLELLHSFAQNALASEIKECFSYLSDDLRNTPEEFAAMCGIVGFCVRNRNDIGEVLEKIRAYASHKSWRIRESVAIGIQEIAGNNMDGIIRGLEEWADGGDYEKRAVVAALCEPGLLKEKSAAIRLFRILEKITMPFERIEGKLTDGQNTLRQTLGYGWSVAVAALPARGKAAFESISGNSNRHIRWIAKENLKKHRLSVMDGGWTEKMRAAVSRTR